MVEFFILVAAGLYFLVIRPIWEIGSGLYEGRKRGRRKEIYAALVMSEDEERKMRDDFENADSRAECLKEIEEDLNYVFDGKRYPWMDKTACWGSCEPSYTNYYLLGEFPYICYVLYAAKKHGKYSRILTEGTRRSCIVQDLSQEESDIVLKKMALTAEQYVMKAHPLDTKEATMLTWPSCYGGFGIRPRLDTSPYGNVRKLTL